MYGNRCLMAKKLYLGNLPFTATEVEIRQSFSECGEVLKVQIVMDRVSGRSKGFAFVDMATDEAGKAAIEKFNEATYAGKTITVSEAKSTSENRRPPLNNRRNNNRNYSRRGAENKESSAAAPIQEAAKESNAPQADQAV